MGASLDKVRRGSTLTPGKRYRITEIYVADPDPSLKVGDVVLCSATPGPGEVEPEPNTDIDSPFWFADYLGDGEWFGTLVSGLEEVETE